MVRYIRLTTATHKGSISLAELKDRSKRTYEMAKYIFYAIKYILECILLTSGSGISTFLMPESQSQ